MARYAMPLYGNLCGRCHQPLSKHEGPNEECPWWHYGVGHALVVTGFWLAVAVACVLFLLWFTALH